MPRARPDCRSFARLAGLTVAVVLLSAMPGGVGGAGQYDDPGGVTADAARQTAPAQALAGFSTSLAETVRTAEGIGRVVAAVTDAALEERARRELAHERAETARRQAQADLIRVEAERRRAEAEAQAKAAAQAAAAERARREAARYTGRNHFWYPALRIDRPVDWFPCERKRAPDSPVYRWGCAGGNNVYLLAHAWSWFKPLNRAYYAGTLAAGQLVAYADANGRTRFYRLDWWKTWRPLPSAKWAWASQSRSSLTLQTCVGANSELRLFVRFHEVAAP
jgi:hypothetical protein